MYKDIRQNGKSIVKVMKNGYIIWQKPNPGILPEGYIECEYLESHGTECIDLGFVPSDSYGLKLSGCILSEKEDAVMIGARNHTNSRYGQWTVNPSYSRIYLGWNTTDDSTGRRVSLSENFDVKMNYFNSRTKSVTFNGSETYTDNITETLETNLNNTCCMFGRKNNDGDFVFTGSFKINSCEITEGDEIIHKYIPCLDNLGAPCMYDAVSNLAFYNQGTGTFGYKIKDPELEYAGYGTLYKLPLGDTYIKDFGWMRGYYHDVHANVVGSGTSDTLTGLSNPILIEPGYTYTVVRPSPSGADNRYNAWFPVPAPGRPGENAKNYKLLCGGDSMSPEMSQPSDARYLYVSFKAYNTANFDRNYNGIYITKSRTV